MPDFGRRSTQRLMTCDSRLIKVANLVVVNYDCMVVEGHRSLEKQQEMWETGRSKLKPGLSKHNKSPSLAVDLAPYYADETPRVPWSLDTPEIRARWYHFAGYVLGVASSLGIRLRWGGDWDGDHKFADQSFHDLPHFELVD